MRAFRIVPFHLYFVIPHLLEFLNAYLTGFKDVLMRCVCACIMAKLNEMNGISHAARNLSYRKRRGGGDEARNESREWDEMKHGIRPKLLNGYVGVTHVESFSLSFRLRCNETRTKSNFRWASESHRGGMFTMSLKYCSCVCVCVCMTQKRETMWYAKQTFYHQRHMYLFGMQCNSIAIKLREFFLFIVISIYCCACVCAFVFP